MHITKKMNMHNCQLCRKEWLGRCFGKKYGKDVSVDNEPCKCYEFGGSEERLKEIENNMKRWFTVKIGGNIMKRDLVDELYKTAYKRYREKYPNKDFASIPNFLDSLWFSIEGELNRNGYNTAKKYVEEADLIVL